jgi:hypothetical protein
MPEENALTAKVGPLPLVVWVAGGSAVVLVFMMMRNKGNSGAQGMQTNQVSALAPTEAEAFGTMEQQQQDVVNALTTLGNNQSALGGSMSTLTGIVTQQGADNAASFQNLQNGQSTIEQGQQSAASASSNYYSSLLSNLTNYFNSLGSQINGVNSNVSQVGGAVGTVSNQVSGVSNAQGAQYASLLNWLQSVSGQVQGVSGQVAGVSNQVQGVSGQVAGVQSSVGGTQADVDALGRFLGWQFYQIPNRYAAYIPGQGPGNYGGTPIGMV